MNELLNLIRPVPFNKPNSAQYEEAFNLVEAGNIHASLPLFQAAVEVAPKVSQYWVSFIAALIITDQLDDAKLVLSYGLNAGLEGEDCDLLSSLLCGSNEAPNEAVVDELFKWFSEQEYLKVEYKVRDLLEASPNWLAGWKILTDTLLMQKKDAKFSSLRALELNIKDAQEHCYYGMILKNQGDLIGAGSAYEKAIQLKPDYAAAYNNLGIVKKDLGDIESAVDCYRQALTLNPNYASCFSNLLFCYAHSNKLDAQALFNEHCKFSQQYETTLKAFWGNYTNNKHTKRKLSVGFVSADFREHSLANFFEPVLHHLANLGHLELHAYSNHAIEDAVTERLKNKFRCWSQVVALSDNSLAQKIRNDSIDILFDLDGHTAGNRLLTFAMKPAPIQVSWLGYLSTTGLSAMNYYLTDAYLAPPGLLDNQFTEKLIQLPASAPFSPSVLSPEVNALPSVENGYITFACFNRIEKITPDVVVLWSKLLLAIPTAKLLLGAMPQKGSCENMIKWFDEHHIDSQRIIFYPRTGMQDYLNLHHKVDLCLDTYPSNGVTTTCHAAWMGVPTLCIAGDRLASRGAMALMSHLGLQEFVAQNEDDFIFKAVSLANDLNILLKIRATLREKFNASALSQPDLIADSLTSALRMMWIDWCENKPAKSFISQIQH